MIHFACGPYTSCGLFISGSVLVLNFDDRDIETKLKEDNSPSLQHTCLLKKVTCRKCLTFANKN